MNSAVLKLCEAVRAAGGRAMLVGGCVRDRLVGVESKDFDIEVYGLAPERLRSVLETIAPVNAVGESFAVYKLAFVSTAGESAAGLEHSRSVKSDLKPSRDQPHCRFEIDVSIPRRESKSGRGHKGFTIEGDPAMSFAEAGRRRDFTINAILFDPLTEEVIDPYGGVEDLRNRVLRAVAEETFVEDSLRVLRAVQLAARFEMTVEANTVELCRGIDLSDLPRERIWGEIEKLLTLAPRPSIGLLAAREISVLDRLFPKIALRVARGRAFEITARALDEAVALARGLNKPKRVAVMLAVLLHQLRLEEAGAILERLGLQTLDGYDVHQEVIALIGELARPREFYEGHAADGAFRRLSRRVELDLLYRVAVACRQALGGETPPVAEQWFIGRARVLGVEHTAPAAILKGRHLLEEGFEAGPQMGELLRQVYELQLDGVVSTLEEGVAAARLLSGTGSRSPST